MYSKQIINDPLSGVDANSQSDHGAGVKALLGSSQTKESSSEAGHTITYAAIKEVENNRVYDLFDANGNRVLASMTRLVNEYYPKSLSFNFYLGDNFVYFISKKEWKKLLECETAIPLSDELFAYKTAGNPYWGIADKNGNILLRNTRYGQIYGLTSDGHIFCSLSLDKAGIIKWKEHKVILSVSYKTPWVVLMSPETNFVCLNSNLIYPHQTDNGTDRITIREKIFDIISTNILVLNSGALFYFNEKKSCESFTNARNLCHDDWLIWGSRTSFSIKQKKRLGFTPVSRQGNYYIVEGKGRTYKLFDANEGKELIPGMKKMSFLDEKNILYQEKDNIICIYDTQTKKRTIFETDYELLYSAIINNLLWVVTTYDRKYCCYLFELNGNEVVADRLCQYGFFAPYDKKSFIYAKDKQILRVENDSRKEDLLSEGSQNYKSGTKIIPIGDSFLVMSSPRWELINHRGKSLINDNKECTLPELGDTINDFVKSSIILFEKNNQKKRVGAYSVQGRLIIPCEYDIIEHW